MTKASSGKGDSLPFVSVTEVLDYFYGPLPGNRSACASGTKLHAQREHQLRGEVRRGVYRDK